MTALDGQTFEVVCANVAELDREDWLKLRLQGIGSSDAAPAMGMSPWRSAYSLWCEKTGATSGEADSERFLWGRLIEPVILDEAERRGWVSMGARSLMLRSSERPWMLANPDMLCGDVVVEVKTAHPMDDKRWDEGVPDQYAIQAMHLMAVTGRRQCVFPVLFGFDALRRFDVDWDPELAEVMFAQEAEFWRRVEENDPPDVDGSESTMLALRERYFEVASGESVELPAEAREWLATRQVSMARIAAENEVVNGVKARVMAALGEAEIGTVNGDKAVTWRKTKTGSRQLRFIEKGEK